MNIQLSNHSLDRDTNIKLDKEDLSNLVNLIVSDFGLEKSYLEIGFYKFIYESIVIVLKKESIENIKLITIYPLMKNEIIMLNINFDKKRGYYQGPNENNRIKVRIEQKKVNKKTRIFHKNNTKRFLKSGVIIGTPAPRKKKKILKSMDKTFKAMLFMDKPLFSLHFYRDKYDKKYFGKVDLSKVLYIIKPRLKINPKGYYYLLNDKQRLLRTLHRNDFDQLMDSN